jgi:prevent-host-death family protein
LEDAMAKIPATEFKARCLELMDRVADRRETYVITKRGKPVARLVPVEPRPRESIFGWLRGKAWIEGDIVSPVTPPEDWEALDRTPDAKTKGHPSGSKRRTRRRNRSGR